MAGFTVPPMLAAHLLTARVAPRPIEVVLVAAVVLLVAALLPARRTLPLALVVGLAQLAGHTLLALHPFAAAGTPDRGCLPVVGHGAEVGVQLALLRPDTACPRGTYLAGSPLVAASAAVVSALAILVGHALLAAFAAVLVLSAEATLRLMGAFGRVVRILLPVSITISTAPRVRPVPVTPRALVSRWSPRAVSLRGPPAGPIPAV